MLLFIKDIEYVTRKKIVNKQSWCKSLSIKGFYFSLHFVGYMKRTKVINFFL